MKLSDILLVSLFLVMGAIIFAIKKSQVDLVQDAPNATAIAPAPELKPAAPMDAIPELRLNMSSDAAAGNHGRLSLDEFLAKGTSEISITDTTPKTTVEKLPPEQSIIKRPRKNKGDQASLNKAPNTAPQQTLSSIAYATAEPTNLPYLPPMKDIRLVDRVAEMAEASPLQPESRGCGTLKQNFDAPPKHAKVRSVAMERNLTERTSIGVEYVYKDGCYKNAIAPLQSRDMPGDDGVNLRVNMKF